MKSSKWNLIMVVVTNPFAKEQMAAAKAAAVARRCKAKVMLFNTFMVPQPLADTQLESREEIIEAAIHERHERLASIAAKLRLPRSTKCVVRWDYPIDEAIVREVRRSKPDLLITESHRHGRLARMVLANTDWQLIRNCPCPVWLARSAGLPKRSRWLVAVDPRHTHAKPARLDDRLLRAARDATHQTSGHVAVVHAYEAPATSAPALFARPKPLQESMKGAREYLAATVASIQALARKYGVEPEACTVRRGPAVEVIAAEARRQRTDVLVMGAVSRSLLTRPVIGATAERVIDHVDCDVFIVKPAGFKAPVTRSAIEF